MEINANTEVKAGLETNHILDLSDRLYKIILAIIGLVAIYIVGQMAYDFQALPQNAPHEISVSGEGKAYIKPDVAVINFGVTVQSAKSQDAANQGNQKMNEVIKAIKELGVEDKDIRTTYYNLSPVYGRDTVIPMGAGGSGAVSMIYPYPTSTKITGYSLEQQVEVKIRNFDNINQIIDMATKAGANTVGSLQFTVDDIEKVKSEAREKAIDQAKEKIQALARQSGISIGKLINVSEGYSPMPYGAGYGGVTLDKASMAPEIQAGQMEIISSVTLTYRVK